MNPAKFALLLGVGLLAFLFVAALYVVWTRIVGLDPTVAQKCASLSATGQAALAAVSGGTLGAVSLAAPSVPVGVAGMVLLAASSFAGLLVFELVQQRQRAGV
ncbi:hypothetical protein [Halorussus litoreus]|uniref:hypothetical protein n=1 Tax=Halorussus litoreus TaxID=1710536 RepID=UPI000E266C85|nr:hypothetical protein [Halorussus litoreus]